MAGRRPLGIWIVSGVATLFALAMLQNLFGLMIGKTANGVEDLVRPVFLASTSLVFGAFSSLWAAGTWLRKRWAYWAALATSLSYLLIATIAMFFPKMIFRADHADTFFVNNSRLALWMLIFGTLVLWTRTLTGNQNDP